MSKNTFAGIFVTQAVAICCLVLPHDPFEEYFQRKDGVTLSAGSAKTTNSVTHIIDPWPPHAGNTRIPGNGQRMSGAVERYRDVSKLPEAPRPIATEYGVTTNVIGSGKQ